MIEPGQGDVIIRSISGFDIFDLATQAQVNQEIIAGLEIVGQLLGQDILLYQNLDSLTRPAAHNAGFHGQIDVKKAGIFAITEGVA